MKSVTLILLLLGAVACCHGLATDRPYSWDERMSFERALGDGWDFFARAWVLDRLGEMAASERDQFKARWAEVEREGERSNVIWAFAKLKTESDKRVLLRKLYTGQQISYWLGEKKAEVRRTEPISFDERRKWEVAMDKWDLFARIFFVDKVATLPGDERDRLWALFSKLSLTERAQLGEMVKTASQEERGKLFMRIQDEDNPQSWLQNPSPRSSEEKADNSTQMADRPYTWDERMRFERALGPGWDLMSRGWLLDRLGELTTAERERFMTRWTSQLTMHGKSDISWAFNKLKTDEDKRELLRRFHTDSDYSRWLGDKRLAIRKTEPFGFDERRQWELAMDKWDWLARVFVVDNIAMLPGDERDRLWDSFSKLSPADVAQLGEIVRTGDHKKRADTFAVIRTERDTNVWLGREAGQKMTTEPSKTRESTTRRSAARSARPTTSPSTARPTMSRTKSSQLSPDDKFLHCCKTHKGISEGCYKFCNHNTFNQATLTAIFLSQTTCPRDKIGAYLYCLGSGHDHTACCKARGVHTTSAGELCTAFCNMSSGSRLGNVDARHLPCWDRMDKMSGCFRDYRAGSA